MSAEGERSRLDIYRQRLEDLQKINRAQGSLIAQLLDLTDAEICACELEPIKSGSQCNTCRAIEKAI